MKNLNPTAGRAARGKPPPGATGTLRRRLPYPGHGPSHWRAVTVGYTEAPGPGGGFCVVVCVVVLSPGLRSVAHLLGRSRPAAGDGGPGSPRGALGHHDRLFSTGKSMSDNKPRTPGGTNGFKLDSRRRTEKHHRMVPGSLPPSGRGAAAGRSCGKLEIGALGRGRRGRGPGAGRARPGVPPALNFPESESGPLAGGPPGPGSSLLNGQGPKLSLSACDS